MNYAGKTFSVAVGSDDYRREFDRIFGPKKPNKPEQTQKDPPKPAEKP